MAVAQHGRQEPSNHISLVSEKVKNLVARSRRRRALAPTRSTARDTFPDLDLAVARARRPVVRDADLCAQHGRRADIAAASLQRLVTPSLTWSPPIEQCSIRLWKCCVGRAVFR